MKPNLASGFQRHRAAILLGSLALAAGCACFCILHSREPVHEGRTLSFWVKQLNQGDADQRRAAVAALRAMDSRAVPALMAALEPRDGRLRNSLNWVGRHLPSIRPSVRDRCLSVDVERGYAANALGAIGPTAKAAVPALIAASADSNSFCAARAKAALIQIRQDWTHSPVLPPAETRNLTNWLQDAEVLLALGSNVQASASRMVAAIGTNNAQRFEMVEALGRNNREPHAAVVLLRGLLKDHEPGIRANALNMLIMQRAFASAARADILRCVNDPDAGVRANAKFALTFAFPEQVASGAVSKSTDSAGTPSGESN